MSLIILVADGARADSFDAGFADGTLPALARLRATGRADWADRLRAAHPDEP